MEGASLRDGRGSSTSSLAHIPPPAGQEPVLRATVKTNEGDCIKKRRFLRAEAP